MYFRLSILIHSRSMFTRITLIRLRSINRLWRMNLSTGNKILLKQYLLLSLEGIHFDPCSNCEIPCSKHVPSPPEILKKIDQSDMMNSVEKHRRHLCIGQPIRPSQWPKHIRNLQGDYVKELTRILQEKQNAIGYSTLLTSASVETKTNSEDTADWYLFPDQVKISNVNIKQIERVIQRLFVNDKSTMKIKAIEDNNHLPIFDEDIRCERLHGFWMLVCCHTQRDERCGIFD
jgi:hypothetical protein